MRYYTPELNRLKRIAIDAKPATIEEAESLLGNPLSVQLSLHQLASLFKAAMERPSGEVAHLVKNCAAVLRQRLFGSLVVPMAPVEIANTCASDCLFCGWRSSNQAMKRLRMPNDLILFQVEYLLDLGISYIEFVSGDDIRAVREQLPYLVNQTRALFAEKGVQGKTCFCTLALTEKQYAMLKEAGADAMIVWQESYDPQIFAENVTGGPKAYGVDDEWNIPAGGNGWLFRLQSQERALRAGLEVAIGTMLGLNPDMVFEFLATVDHARYLVSHYDISEQKPLIIGMPIWNPIPTRSTDLRPAQTPFFEEMFPVIAALYLLALPSRSTWVFPNCRVPLPVQVDAARVAGVFTSTEVKLGPGGYLPAIIRLMEKNNQDTTPLRKRLVALLRDADEDTEELTRSLDSREQFVHHFHAHDVYVRALANAGLQLVRGVSLEPLPLSSTTSR